MFSACILASGGASDVVTSPYNAVCNMASLLASSDVVLPFDNACFEPETASGTAGTVRVPPPRQKSAGKTNIAKAQEIANAPLTSLYDILR